MAIPLMAMLGGMGAGGAGGLSSLLGAAAPGMSQVGAAGAMKLGGAGGMKLGGGGAPDFWSQFTQTLKGPGGAANAVDMVGAATAGQGDAMRRLSSTFRGPTMPFLPHLNTSQVGPNRNPGQEGLAMLLQQIAGRRG